jgi:diguanylate cyclase
VVQAPAQLVGEKGLSLARAAVERIGALGLPQTPQNYEVWLGYHSQGLPDLRRRIDAMLASGEVITSEICKALHEEFFSDVRVSHVAMSANETVATQIGGVVAALQAAGERSGAYGETLTDTAKELEQLRSHLIQVRTEALTDGLTGLANRRKFDATIRARVAESTQHRSELTLMMCDIDHFKRFNDSWGHQTGDQIIRFIASTLKNAAHSDFCVARYGGEEFAVVMPRISLAEARMLAESVRATVESKKLFRRSTNDDLGRVTVSLGIARYRYGEPSEALIERADACLYASKRAGRNRLTTDLDEHASAA